MEMDGGPFVALFLRELCIFNITRLCGCQGLTFCSFLHASLIFSKNEISASILSFKGYQVMVPEIERTKRMNDS